MTSPSEKLKIFISWSGDLASSVTAVLRDWLPLMFDGIELWASMVDIEAGARWEVDLFKELDSTGFGIIIVTRANQSAPWLNFEAGALSKRFNGENSKVAPLLVDMTSPAQITSPIKQFQAGILNKEGVARLVKSIAKSLGSDPATADRRFQSMWPVLEEKLEKVLSNISEEHAKAKRPDSDMLEEILVGIRELRRARVPDQWAGSISRETLDAREQAVDHMIRHIFGGNRVQLSSVLVTTTIDGVMHINVQTTDDPQSDKVRIATDEVIALGGPYQINVQPITAEDISHRQRFEDLQRKTIDPMLGQIVPPTETETETQNIAENADAEAGGGYDEAPNAG